MGAITHTGAPHDPQFFPCHECPFALGQGWGDGAEMRIERIESLMSYQHEQAPGAAPADGDDVAVGDRAHGGTGRRAQIDAGMKSARLWPTRQNAGAERGRDTGWTDRRQQAAG